MQNRDNSAFSDEDSRMMKAIYDHTVSYRDISEIIIHLEQAGCQTEDSHLNTSRYEDAALDVPKENTEPVNYEQTSAMQLTGTT